MAVGLYQYVATSSQTARRPFLEEQTKLCFQASETVARIATTDDPVKWKTAYDDFWMLYWGPLAIVEDRASDKIGEFRDVAKEMVDFGKALKTIDKPLQNLPLNQLTGSAIAVSRACQTLVTSWWDAGILRIPGTR